MEPSRTTDFESRLYMKGKDIAPSKVKKLMIASYELLKVIRHLHYFEHVVHCDTIYGNRLVYKSNNPSGYPHYTADTMEHVGDTEYICSMDYTLQRLDDMSEDSRAGPQMKEALLNERNPLATDNEQWQSYLLLTDLDSAEDINDTSENKSQSRTGTLIFMARMARKTNYYPSGDRRYSPAAPNIHEKILIGYGNWHFVQLESYADIKEELVTVEYRSKVPEYRHQPRYDAESVFWILFYWVILAQPVNGEEKKINSLDWAGLVGKSDFRYSALDYFMEDRFHPFYEPLGYFIDDMAQYLLVDTDLVTEKKKQEPYYLIQVFQILIINFIIDNHDKPFMQEPKNEKDREVEQPEPLWF